VLLVSARGDGQQVSPRVRVFPSSFGVTFLACGDVPTAVISVKQSVIQFVFVKPTMAFITLGIVVVTGEESHTWAPIEMTIYNLSYTIALYGLVG
jgi:hypothetical protein